MSNQYLVGLPVNEIPTPALVVDLDILAKNIENMADYMSKVNTQLRPHAKTHKTPTIAHMQMRAGAVGLCCATVGEAEVMVYSGIPEVMIANEVVESCAMRRAVNLCRQARVLMIVDDKENVQNLAAVARQYGVTVEVLVDLDVGQGRCGVRSLEQLVGLAREVRKQQGLRLIGVFGYEGHLQFIVDREERSKKGRAATGYLVAAAKELSGLGIDIELVSGAGTGTYDIASEFAEMTEIQAGSYIFMDGTYQKLGLPFGQSLSVLSTVVSRPAPEIAIFDVGIKGISPERFYPSLQNCTDGTAEVKSLSEEHATAYLSCGFDPRPGEKYKFTPSHCCSTVNLYDVMVGVRSGKVESLWPIAARRA
jgi:D-serine deaminase-like pyridoxal phosphate-dependent protein